MPSFWLVMCLPADWFTYCYNKWLDQRSWIEKLFVDRRTWLSIERGVCTCDRFKLNWDEVLIESLVRYVCPSGLWTPSVSLVPACVICAAFRLTEAKILHDQVEKKVCIQSWVLQNWPYLWRYYSRMNLIAPYTMTSDRTSNTDKLF